MSEQNNQPTSITKEFKLSTWAVKNRISVYVILFIIAVIGFKSYTSMPKESFPEIKQPTIYVNTPYPGNSPVDIENLITRPMEQEINSISGVKKLTSTSVQDISIIIAEFEIDIPSSEALQEVKDAVDRARGDLPNDLPVEPGVMELDFSEFPVMNVNVSGDYSEKELKEYAEYLQEEFENLSEVSSVDISGLTDDEVEIAVDRIKMEALEISLNDIEGAISQENITMSGGDIKSIDGSDITRRNLRVDGEFKDYRELENVIVKSENQKIVYLRDIAQIHYGQKEPTSFARLNNNTVVTLDVKKKSGANLLNAAEKIQAIIADAKLNQFPKDLAITITNDQSKFTKKVVNNLENSIIMGVILVVVVLIFFLGLRNSLFVGIAIPMSMLMGIGLLNFAGTTLNMMVLFSLILALGMLVDNGIVVVENIYRLRTEGLSLKEASKQGVGEVASAIISSTATTVAAFIPLLFWKDLMGEFMKYLPITLIIVLSSSLFVALVINPVLTADWMKTTNNSGPSRKVIIWSIILAVLGFFLHIGPKPMLGGLMVILAFFMLLNHYVLTPGGDWFMNNVMPRLENFYARSASFALSGWKPVVFMIGTVVLLVFSLVFFGMSNPKIVFFPENEPNYVNVFLEAPQGTDILTTNEITKKLEAKVAKAIEPYSAVVEAQLAQVGEKTADPNEGPQMGSSPNKARITVSFHEYEKRALMEGDVISTSKIMQVIKDSCRVFPEAELTISKDNMGPPVGKPINLEVRGEDYLTLIDEVQKIKKIMEDANLPGVDQLKTDLEVSKPMLAITIDRDAARRFGLSTVQIAATIRTALLGKEISKWKDGEDDYEIWLRFDQYYRNDLDGILNTLMTFRDMATGRISQVPIKSVIKSEFTSTYGAIHRRDMDRVITIYSEVEEDANANELVGEYKKILAGYQLPQGYEMKFTGEQEEQAASTAFLANAMLLASFIIFLIIVTQFNSIIGPLIIMFSVLFSTIGVFLGFGLFRMPFSIMMSGIGIISLAGIVVNNAIVLIDYTNLLRQRKRSEMGLDEDAELPLSILKDTIVEGGRTRLRPVLLTAITTVLGLVPLAIGLNINFFTLITDYDGQFYVGGDNAVFWGPMAWTVIFGLIFATFLTLIIVPVMFYLSEVGQRKVKGLFAKI